MNANLPKILIIVLLVALGAPPSLAQYQSPPSWRVTVTPSGSVSGTIAGSSTGSFAWGTSTAAYLESGIASVALGQSATITTQGIYHVKAEWLSNGVPAPNPPKTVIMKTTALCSWYVPTGRGSGNASNGLGHPELSVSTTGGQTKGTSSGSYYESFDGSMGLIEYDVPVSGNQHKAVVNVTGL